MKYLLVLLPAIAMLLLSSCRKSSVPGTPAGNKLSYGDSIFYLKTQSYQLNPVNPRSGTYSAYPENLLIDPATGAITVTMMGHGLESQTGMRYKVRYQSADGSVKDSTNIVLAGINYIDRIYYLSQNDSIIRPLYNANLNNGLPAGTYGIMADTDLAIDPANGQINIRECMRRGMFNLPAENGEWEEVTIQYKSNDPSNQAMNRIDIALYFYNSIADIPSNVSAVMREHQKMTLGVPQPEVPITFAPIDPDLPDNLSMNRPRPPCIIIVAN